MLDYKEPALMTPWFQTLPLRFDEEREGLEDMGFILDVDLLDSKMIVVFSGKLDDYPDRQLKLVFPWSYPSMAPRVLDDGNCPLLLRHQKPDGREYCLFGPEGKDWYAKLTGVDALAATEKLLDDVLGENEKSSIIDDPFPEPYSAQVKVTEPGVILVPPGISDFLPNDESVVADGMIRIKYADSNGGRFVERGIVIEAQFKDREDKANCSGQYNRLVNGTESKGRLTFLPALEHPILDGEAFAALLKQYGLSIQGNFKWHALVFPEESGDRSTRRFSWLIFKRTGSMTFSPLRTITYRTSERSARIPGIEFLADKRVAIVGCGALGSKIAVALASSGVTRFTLVDKDCMEPANSIRHECGVEWFGLPKTHALAARLRSLDPDVECELLPGDPFAGSSVELSQKGFRDMGRCDLIVNATGRGGIGRAINELSKTVGVPSLHLSVTDGGWSGEVVRFIPSKSACWLCFQEAFGDEVLPGHKPPHGHVFGPGCDQPTFTGTTYELGMVANLSAGFAVDTLRVTSGGSSEYGGNYLLWEGRDANGRLLQRTSVKSFSSRSVCTICGDVP